MSQMETYAQLLGLRFQVWRMNTHINKPITRQLVAAFAERDAAQEYADEYIEGDYTIAEIVDVTVQA